MYSRRVEYISLHRHRHHATFVSKQSSNRQWPCLERGQSVTSCSSCSSRTQTTRREKRSKNSTAKSLGGAILLDCNRPVRSSHVGTLLLRLLPTVALGQRHATSLLPPPHPRTDRYEPATKCDGRYQYASVGRNTKHNQENASTDRMRYADMRKTDDTSTTGSPTSNRCSSGGRGIDQCNLSESQPDTHTALPPTFMHAIHRVPG